MKNPCDICICKVMCTEICQEKENYLTLIKHAIIQNSHLKRGIRISNHNSRKYLKMQQQHYSDTAQIYVRNFNKKGGNVDDPVSRKIRKSLRNAERTKRSEYY
jgi:hypothetical protein